MLHERDKLAVICDKCCSVAQSKYSTKQRFQSLLGKLIMCPNVYPASVFINCILALFGVIFTYLEFVILWISLKSFIGS